MLAYDFRAEHDRLILIRRVQGTVRKTEEVSIVEMYIASTT